MAQARLTLRSVKGSPLSVAEADAMMRYLEALPIPKWIAVDAAIVGAYPNGIVVDSAVTGKRYRLKTGGTPTVDPDTDPLEAHWELVSSSGAGSSDIPFTRSSAGLAHPETPSAADFAAFQVSEPTADGGDLFVYNTPLGKRWESSLSGVTGSFEMTTPVVSSIEYDPVPAPTIFEAKYTIKTPTGTGVEIRRNNDGGTAWVLQSSGSSGGGDSVTYSTASTQTAPFTASVSADVTVWPVDVAAQSGTSSLAVTLPNGTTVGDRVIVLDVTRSCTGTRTVDVTGLQQGISDNSTINTPGGVVELEWLGLPWGWKSEQN